MEGPTTVSALIHAATMVKAGVYLVARIYPVYVHSSEILGVHPLTVVAYVGGITAAFAGLLAVINNDIKGVLAYSTISHLGILMLALGVHAYTGALLHLLNHAFFKAELFLVSGCVLHAVHDVRDLHKLGGLKEKMKTTWILALLGAFAISGLPPYVVGGFWSKEEVLLGVNATGDPILLVLGIIAAVTGALYIFRWFFLIFSREPRSEEAKHAHEMPLVMTIPVAILAIGSILWGIPILIEGKIVPIGLVFVEKVVGVEHDATVHAMAIGESGVISHVLLAVLTISIGLLGAVLMAYTYHLGKIDFSKYPVLIKIQKWFQQGTFIDRAYDAFVDYVFARGISKGLAWFDSKVVDGIFESFHVLGAKISAAMAWFDLKVIDRIVEGFRPSFKAIGRTFGKIQTGHISDYMILFGIGLTLLSAIFVLYWFGWLSLAYLVPS